MRPISLREPPGRLLGVPEIFGGGLNGVIRRAVVVGNGFAGSENQSIGLVRALGLSGRQSFYVSIMIVVVVVVVVVVVFEEISVNKSFNQSKNYVECKMSE